MTRTHTHMHTRTQHTHTQHTHTHTTAPLGITQLGRSPRCLSGVGLFQQPAGAIGFRVSGLGLGLRAHDSWSVGQCFRGGSGLGRVGVPFSAASAHPTRYPRHNRQPSKPLRETRCNPTGAHRVWDAAPQLSRARAGSGRGGARRRGRRARCRVWRR